MTAMLQQARSGNDSYSSVRRGPLPTWISILMYLIYTWWSDWRSIDVMVLNVEVI